MKYIKFWTVTKKYIRGGIMQHVIDIKVVKLYKFLQKLWYSAIKEQDKYTIVDKNGISYQSKELAFKIVNDNIEWFGSSDEMMDVAITLKKQSDHYFNSFMTNRYLFRAKEVKEIGGLMEKSEINN